MPIVEMPNGDQVEFPDDMPKEQIGALIRQKFPEAVPDPSVYGANDYQRRAKGEAALMQEGRQQGAVGDFFESALTNIPFGRSIAAIPGGVYRSFRDDVGFGEGYNREKALIDEQARMRSERSPKADIAGAVTGAVAGAVPVVKGAQAIGLGLRAGAGLGSRVAAGAAGGAGMGAVYGFDQGVGFSERSGNAVSGAGLGAVTGAAIPALGAGARKVGERAMSSVRAALNPQAEAARRVASALARDRAEGLAMNIDDLAAARASGQPLINADRGGQNTRSLARSAANQSPDVWGQMDDLTKQRFYDQSNRAVQKVSKIVGGKIDDLAAQDQLRSAARRSNSAAYEKAYRMNFAGGQPMQLDAIQSRLPADAVREAMKIAKAEGRPFGEQLIASIDDTADAVTFRRAPSMREWDYIQRGLRGSADKAFRSGSGGAGTAYKELRQDLLGILDQVNPAFKQARQGASAAFGAEDALEAGKKFAATRRNTGEMARAIKDMKPAEKKLFETGFASELVDRLKSPSDSVDVIKQVFGSPEAREKIAMAFGPKRAREIEAFARVEAAMQITRQSLGNSTTAKQLAEMGLVGGANIGATTYGAVTGDWRYSALIAAGTGLRYGKNKVDGRVVENIGKLLLSGDQKAMDRIIANAQISNPHMTALRAITDKFAEMAPVAAAGAAVSISGQN